MTTVAEPAVAAAPSAGTGLAVTSLFQGYNSFLATGAQSALTGTSQSVGAKQRINYTVCTSIEDILNSLDIDTSVSYTSPEYSASAKLNYAHSLHVTEHTVTVVIYANRIIATTQATGAQLAGSAPTPDTLKAFCTQYGDSWVNSLTTGAEYFAAYCFYAETKDEQTSVVASLSGSGIVGSGELSANVQTALNDKTSTSRTSVSMSQMLLGVSNAPLPPDTEMVNWALHTFPGLTVNAPVVISFSVTGYETIGALIDVFAPVVATRTQLSGPPTGDHPLNVAQQLAEVQECADAIAEITAAYNLYGYTADTEMNAATAGTKAAQVAADLVTLDQKILAMGQDPTAPVAWPTITSLTYGTPSVNLTFDTLLALGGQNNQSGGNLMTTGTTGLCQASTTPTGGSHR